MNDDKSETATSDALDAQSEGNLKEPSDFRLDARHFAITYSQAEKLTRELIKETLMKRYEVEHIVIGEEAHKDGGKHFHVYLGLVKRTCIRNCKKFDIEGYHPNFKKVRNLQNWYKYCKKEDKILEYMNWIPLNSNNYIKRKADFDAFKMDVYKWGLKGKPEAVGNNFGIDLHKTGKKRHYWIVGPSSIGKTEFIENSFEGCQGLYKCMTDKYYFDRYDGEKWIVFDDVIPPFQLLLHASNVYKTITSCYGLQRNVVRYYEMYMERQILVFTNIRPTYWEEEAFQTRFNLVDLNVYEEEEGSLLD